MDLEYFSSSMEANGKQFVLEHLNLNDADLGQKGITFCISSVKNVRVFGNLLNQPDREMVYQRKS